MDTSFLLTVSSVSNLAWFLSVPVVGLGLSLLGFIGGSKW